MISRNLRHLRVFLKVADVNSLTAASELSNVSQPAVTQAIRKLETEAGGALFDRTQQGIFLTPRGDVLASRVRSAIGRLDSALQDISPRLRLTATVPQLEALIAVREAENFTLAARRLGFAQPTIHRAVTQLEHEAGQLLFKRSSLGLAPTRACEALTMVARIAFYELSQADADLAELDGREVGRIVVGSLPLARSVLLPVALARFREARPTLLVTVLDGTYDELLLSLRRGDVDFIVGALRFPPPIDDIVQEPLFGDKLVVLSGLQHPLANAQKVPLEDLVRYPWVVPRVGTPARAQVDKLLETLNGAKGPPGVVETGSILLMRELLGISNHLGCISSQQAEAEVSKGLLKIIDFAGEWPPRVIGLTYRTNWRPTVAQNLFLDLIRRQSKSKGQ